MGPSAIDIPGLTCGALTLDEIRDLPKEFARTATLAQDHGFGGVQIHAAHGFLLSQFLSPLFNKRTDNYGGSAASRMRLLLETVEEVRGAVMPQFVVAVKLNATDQLEGGFEAHESLDVISALDNTGVDLIEISGGTYFPGAKSASDSTGSGPYFIDFASDARKRTTIPLMTTGGFKTKQHAVDAIVNGTVDCVGIARGFALSPDLPERWRSEPPIELEFPRFESAPEGGITAWYTMRLTQVAEDRETEKVSDLDAVRKQYEGRDERRTANWIDRFNDSV